MPYALIRLLLLEKTQSLGNFFCLCFTGKLLYDNLDVLGSVLAVPGLFSGCFWTGGRPVIHFKGLRSYTLSALVYRDYAFDHTFHIVWGHLVWGRFLFGLLFTCLGTIVRIGRTGGNGCS